MPDRKLCPTCQDRPVAVNCYLGERVYYRKQCDACLRKGKKIKPKPPRWFKEGYRKKKTCERCGFQCKFDRQMSVFHVDGDLNNVDWNNLKTVCANCRLELDSIGSNWKLDPSAPGF